MDLLLTSTSASPAKAPPSGGGGQGASPSTARPTDSLSSTENGPFDAVLGSCAQGNATPLKTVPQEQRPLPMLGGGGPASHSQDSSIGCSSREAACLPGRHTAAGESWPGLSNAQAARDGNEQLSQDFEVGGPRGEAGSSARHRIGSETGVLRPEGSFRSDGAQEETGEGKSLSNEGGRARGETQEAGPRIMLSRMEAMKGMEQAGEQQGGDLKSVGQTGQGENAASLAGKDGASWKQDVQMDLPTRPAPPPATSTQTAPAHAAQAGSGGTFRVLRDAVHMRIQDEELGPMRWHIHMSRGKITVEAVVETTRVQELLQNHRDVLEAKLNGLGVEVEEFDVSVDQGSQKFAAFAGSDGSGETPRSTEEGPHDVSLEPVVSRLGRTQDRGLDLYV